ncbi:FHA domain-containing protein [Solidesulfovibrio sp.]|uniref:FHA domain-containing protein n=1 Tax=Solidesulfovibrio sp. TaxID=2910990 RepID=UPI00262C0332|nr:FHA domain-containing protein [Solidesulfovibrio sp.]
MIVTLRIERDGAVLETLTLGPGEHGIGRAPDNAAVLADGAVSSRHALLRVREADAELVDQGSLNGTFVDGEKVARTTFTRAATADICGFRLVFSAKAAPRTRPERRGKAGFGTRAGILLATAVLALGVALAVWLPAQHALDAFARTEALQRGALLARFLAEQNVVPLGAKLLDQLRTASVAAEEGVLQAVVTDPYGKVLAPAQDMGKVLGEPQVGKALKEAGPSIWTGPEGNLFLACPIRDGHTQLGLALVAYRPESALAPPDRAGGAAAGLLAAVLLWAAAAWLLLRLALGPVRIMAEDVGVALKSGNHELAVVPASREMADLKHAVERLLVLSPTGAAERDGPPRASVAPSGPASSAAVDPESPTGASAAGEAGSGTDGGTWCQLDLANYRLTDWSPAFAEHLRSRDLVPPVHLLAAMADAAVLAAVAGAVDDPAEDASRPVENRALTARKEPGPTPGTVRIRLTEAP